MTLLISLSLYSCGGGGRGSSQIKPNAITPNTNDNLSSQVQFSQNQGNKINLNDLRLNNGDGTYTEDSFKWDGTLTVSQINGGEVAEVPGMINNTTNMPINFVYFDPYTNTAYELYYNDSGNLLAYKVNLSSIKSTTTELYWLENSISPILNKVLNYHYPSHTIYIKNHIIFTYENGNYNNNNITVYDFDLANKNTKSITFDNYTFPYVAKPLGTDNGSKLTVISLQNSNNKDKTFAYINPDNVTIDNTNINTGYFTTYSQPSNFNPSFGPTISNGYMYVSGSYEYNNISVVNIENAISGKVIKTLTVKDMFNIQDNSTVYRFGFEDPVASLDGKYVFIPISLYFPYQEVEFYFIDKINTTTNDIVGMYPIYMINGWTFEDFTVSPDGRYIYALLNNTFEKQEYNELLIINTSNNNEKAYKLYINTNIGGVRVRYLNVTKMSTTTDGNYLYIPFTALGSDDIPELYITEIPTSILNNLVK